MSSDPMKDLLQKKNSKSKGNKPMGDGMRINEKVTVELQNKKEENRET